MTRKYITMIISVIIGIVFTGCELSTKEPVTQECEPGPVENVCPEVQLDECTPISTEGYVKKVDNFMIIFDPSASMAEDCYGITKFDFAKNIAACLNQTIPDIELKGALRTFGAPVYTATNYGPDNYLKEDLRHALKGVKSADGASPLDFAIRAAAKDWDSQQGQTALIIISDGVEMNVEPVLAAEEIKKQYRENICIYTIFVGNNPSGRKVMSDVALAGSCGFMVDAKELAAQEGMSNYVKKIFLARDTDTD